MYIILKDRPRDGHGWASNRCSMPIITYKYTVSEVSGYLARNLIWSILYHCASIPSKPKPSTSHASQSYPGCLHTMQVWLLAPQVTLNSHISHVFCDAYVLPFPDTHTDTSHIYPWTEDGDRKELYLKGWWHIDDWIGRCQVDLHYYTQHRTGGTNWRSNNFEYKFCINKPRTVKPKFKVGPIEIWLAR